MNGKAERVIHGFGFRFKIVLSSVFSFLADLVGFVVREKSLSFVVAGEIMGVYFNKMKLLNAAAYGLKQIEFGGDVQVRGDTVPQIRYDNNHYKQIGAHFFGSSGQSNLDIVTPDDQSLCMTPFGYNQQMCANLMG